MPGNCSSTWSIEISPLASFTKYLLRTLISLAVNLVADVIFLILSLSSTRVPFHSALILSSLNNFLCCLQIFPRSSFVLEKSMLSFKLRSLITLKSLISSCFDHLHFCLWITPVLLADEKSLDLLHWDICWSI